jgi:DNA-binding response OmpR family regulator
METTYTVTLDDDPMVEKVIGQVLQTRTVGFRSTSDLVAKLDTLRPTAAFIDIHVDDSSGSSLPLIPQLRAAWPGCAIIVITADPEDRLIDEALSLGADDFIRKPIQPHELKARVRTRILDASEKQRATSVDFDELSLDLGHRSLAGSGGKAYLSNTSAELLRCLMGAKGAVVSRDVLKRYGWGEIHVTDNALDRKIHEVRRALTEATSRVQLHNIYGVGFRLEVEERGQAARG